MVTIPSFNRSASAAGALFFDEQARVLLVEPTYKEGWEIPGGMIEAGESPRAACTREIMEELGLTVKPGRLLAVDWASGPRWGDTILFVFDGGVLDAEEQNKIILGKDELASCRFVTPDSVEEYLPPHLANRVTSAIAARKAGETWYLEHGRRA